MQNDQKKILLAANTLWYLKNFRSNLIDTLQKNGYSIEVLAPSDSTITLSVPVHPVTHLNRKGQNPLQDIALFFEYLSYYRKLKPAIVLNFTIKPNIYSSLACRVLGIPSINTITGLGYVFTRKTILSTIAAFLYRCAIGRHTIVIFQNTDDQQLFVDRNIVTKDSSFIVPGSGIDTIYFSRAQCIMSEQPYSFVVAARMLRDKGIREFIEAAKLVHQSHPSATFALIGPLDTNNPSALSIRDLDFSSTPYITYVGEVSDVRPYFCGAQCVVLPSYREGLPKTLLEAMALELPIITTDVPGCRSVVDGNGITVPTHNTTALADAMKEILNMDSATRQKLGRRGRELTVTVFSTDRVTGLYMDVIKSVKR